MYQVLIKNKDQRGSTQTHKAQIKDWQSGTSNLLRYQNQPFSTTLTHHSQLHNFDQQSQNPYQHYKYKDWGNQIEPHSNPHGSQYGKSSRIEYVSEIEQQQLHPMILSHINNPRPGVNKLIYLKLRNTVSEMKQAHFELAECLEDEKRLMQDFQEKLCFEIEQFFSQHRQNTKASNDEMELQLLKNENNILRQRMERKELEYQRMARELQTFRSSTKKTLSLNIAENGQQKECTKCKEISIKMHSVESQLQKNQQQTEKLHIENQQLQEHIFDIEQKIAGVDLEVERKLKQKMVLLTELKQPSNNKASQQIKLELQELRQKCHSMQLAAAQFSDVSQQLLQLQIKQKQLKKMQLELKKAQKQSEQLRQANYEREHQILEAEQNLSKKINEIRSKESELSHWELELTRKARNNHNVEPPAEQSSQLKVSREISLKSFGKAPQDVLAQNQFEPQIPQRVRTHHQHRQHSSLYKKNLLYKESNYRESNFEKRPVERKYYPTHEYSSREHPNTFTKTNNMVLGNYRQQREPSPYRNLAENRSRIHQNGFNSSQYRELSKNSTHSATKSLKNISPYATPSAVKMRGEGVPLSGLGSKLEKLREEIKKQIQSIK